MIGREWGGEVRSCAVVDLPVAMEPVRPMRRMVGWVGGVGPLDVVGIWLLCSMT